MNKLKIKRTKQEKGITLITLIITIVVLLILAVVAIRAVTGEGILQHAKNAQTEYETAQGEENTTLDSYLATIQNNIPNVSGSNDSESKDELIIKTSSGAWTENEDGTFTSGEVTVKIGDYVEYSYDTVEDYPLSYSDAGKEQTIAQTTGLKWRVLGISDNGELELVSANSTSKLVALYGHYGYNNAITILNNICQAQYSNNSLGINARSLTIADIQKQYSDEAISANYKRGSVESSYFKDATFYEMIFGVDSETKYWLASTYSTSGSYGLYYYYVYVVSSNYIGGDYMMNSDMEELTLGERLLRPFVTLGTDIKVTTNLEENSETNMWTLSK